MREKFISKYPELARAFTAAQIKATKMLSESPAKAAPAVAKYVGGGRLPVALIEKAIKGSQKSFVADPDFIVDGTKVMHDFQASIGTLKAKVKLDELFEPKFYRALKAKKLTSTRQ